MTSISRRMRSLPPGQSVVTILWSPRPAANASSGMLQVARIDAEARQRAARPQDAQRDLERRLRAQRLDRDIDAAAVGERMISSTGSTLREIDDVVGAERARDREALGDRVDADDRGGAHQLGARRGAQADRPLREHRDGVADPDACRFRRRRIRST